MSCIKNLKSILSGDGLKLPKSPSILAGIKDLLTFKGPGEAMERAEGLIESNIQKMKGMLSPANLVKEVEKQIDGMAGQIQQQVNDAIEAATNLKSRLQSLTQGPAKVVDMFKGGVDGLSDLEQTANDVNGQSCIGAALGGVGKVIGGVAGAAGGVVSGLTKSAKMDFKQNGQESNTVSDATETVKNATKDNVLAVDGEQPDLADVESSQDIMVTPVEINESIENIHNSMITSPVKAWPSDHSNPRSYWEYYKPYFEPHVNKFLNGLNSGSEPTNTIQPDTVVTSKSPWVSPFSPTMPQMYTSTQHAEVWGEQSPAGDGDRTICMLFQSYIKDVFTRLDESTGEPIYIVDVSVTIIIIYTTEEISKRGVLLDRTYSHPIYLDFKTSYGQAIQIINRDLLEHIKDSDLIKFNFFDT